MALILSLETSTDVCSVAVHDSARLLASAEIHIPQSHASQLAVLTDQALNAAAVKPGQLKAVAVASGPGSYTGLRIGTSVAKGLCYGLNIPLITISPLDVMARKVHEFNFQKYHLCPMIDAMRMEVYCKLLDPDLNVIYPVQAKVIDQQSFSEVLDNKQVLFFGNGAQKCKSVISHANAVFLDGIYPDASQLGVMAYEHLKENKFSDLMAYEPVYLKEFIIKKSKPAI